MGTKVSSQLQTIRINQQALYSAKGITLLAQPSTSTFTGTTYNSEHAKTTLPKYQNKRELCQKIFENNKKVSQIRRSQKLKDSSTINTEGSQNKNCNINRNQRFSESAKHTDIDSKLKYFENNKKLVQSSIQATICVQRVLNLLNQRSILRNDEFNYLKARNQKSLQCKQKRFKNLEFRELKMKHSCIQLNKQNRNQLKVRQKHATSCYYGPENKQNKSMFPSIGKVQTRQTLVIKRNPRKLDCL